MQLRFACPSCGRPAWLSLPSAELWQCPVCDHSVPVGATGSSTGIPPVRNTGGTPVPLTPVLKECVICGNGELYKKKDFPHWLGISILAAACAAFVIANFAYHQWFAWSVLIGSAIFDGLLYLWVGDAIVCYRCGAHHRSATAGNVHQPFELEIAERYRQERLRREQIVKEGSRE